MSANALSFEAIGTTWQIDLPDGLLVLTQEKIAIEIKQRIEEFDKNYSRFRSDSLVTKMSQVAGAYILPEDAEPLFSLYEDVYRLTNGAVTPLIGQVLSDAGYDATYSLESRPLFKPPTLAEVMLREGRQLQLKQPALLDFGAAGKGYLIDITAGILRKYDLRSFTVDAGGDMIHYSREGERLRVALEYPDDASLAIGVAEISNESLCGSAGNRRAWGDFHHIINPQTLSSPRHIKAIWVTAETALLADMMTTCLFFVAAEYMERHYSFEYLIMKADNTIEKSNGFSAEIFN